MKKQSYFQGTVDPLKNQKPEEFKINRINLDVRPPDIFTHFKNYDYTENTPDEISPGRGLYHGSMDSFKSVKDFLEKRKKDIKNRKERSEKRSNILNSLVIKVS